MNIPDLEIFDVVVVGAGPSGGAAAFTAQKLGLKTALFDKKTFPRQKLCGGLVTGRSRRAFSEIFATQMPDSLVMKKTDVRFSFKGVPLGEMHDVPPLYLTMRWDLDLEVFNRAIAIGVTDFSGCRISAIDLSSNLLILKDGRRIGYKTLIGADGVNSLVAKELFGNSFQRSKIGFGLEVEAHGDHLRAQDPIQIDFAFVDWGYGWVFPKKDSVTIGVGGVLAKNPNIKGAMSNYLSALGVSMSEKDFKGQFIPFGNFKKTPGKGNVVLCGDAAGLVDPITGEGIAYALLSGQLAAISAVESIGLGDTGRLLRIYKRKLKQIHRSIRLANAIRPLLFSRFFEKAIAASFRSSTSLKTSYMRVLAGEAEYPQIILAIIRRLPKLMLTAARK